MKSATADKIPHHQQYYRPSYKNTDNIDPIRVFFNHNRIIDRRLLTPKSKRLLVVDLDHWTFISPPSFLIYHAILIPDNL